MKTSFKGKVKGALIGIAALALSSQPASATVRFFEFSLDMTHASFVDPRPADNLFFGAYETAPMGQTFKTVFSIDDALLTPSSWQQPGLKSIDFTFGNSSWTVADLGIGYPGVWTNAAGEISAIAIFLHNAAGNIFSIGYNTGDQHDTIKSYWTVVQGPYNCAIGSDFRFSGLCAGSVNAGIRMTEIPPPLVDPLPGVPEPATWAMMIAGFGLTGTALRRSRRSGAGRAIHAV